MTKAGFQGEACDGIRLRFKLEFPEQADENTLHRTLDLIEHDDFQVARRRLWCFEQELPARVDAVQMSHTLEALVNDYNKVVRKENKATTAALVLLIVPAAAGVGIDAVTGGGVTGAMAGIGSSVFFDQVKARFPTLGASAARASHHPGSAVAGMLAIAGHVDDLAAQS